MPEVASTTALAISAFFGLCVPGTSSGKIEQTASSERLVPLTDSQRVEYAQAIAGEDKAFRIKSKDHVVLLTTKDGRCHVITSDGDTKAARLAFVASLEHAGGSEENDLASTENASFLEARGIIWTNPQHDSVVVGFTADKSGDKGFYAWAFGIHKD